MLKKYLKVKHNGSTLIEDIDNIDCLINLIKESDSEDPWVIEVVESDPDIVSLLPEFDGF